MYISLLKSLLTAYTIAELSPVCIHLGVYPSSF